MSDERKYTFKQNLSLITRGYKLLAALPKPVLISNVLSSIFGTVLPFINLFFSAEILNELAGIRDQQRLTLLVVLTVSINLIATLLHKAISRWHSYNNSHYWNLLSKIYADKLISMDYIDVESSDVQDQYREITGHHNGMGYGLSRMSWPLPAVFQGIIQIGLSIALTITLFTQRVPVDSAYTWLDSPLTIAAVLFVLSGTMFLTPYLNKIGGKIWAKATHDNNKGNRFFSFYYFKMIDGSDTAKDLRLYNQQRIIDKQLEQDDNFGLNKDKASKGKFKFLVYSKYNAKFASLGAAVSYLSNGLIYLFVALKALAGAFGVGSIVLYVGAITQFGMGFSSLLSSYAALVSNNPFLDKVLQFLDIPNGMYQGSLTTEKRSDKKYEIEFRDVSFKYPASEEYALRNVSFKLNVGQRLAVVGENGSGKTTMIKLLCRLYDPTDGEILLNGIDIRKYNYNEYMAIFSIVFQDFKLLPFTLGQNVAVAVNYDAEHATKALVQAGFGERLASMLKGLDTYLYKNFEEDGVEISGGEAQKIALARALYKNAPFVILDEPTAALDPVAEFEVYSKMNEIVGDKTAVFISHRLSSCRFCNDIAVFHEGALIQRGSHDDLVMDKSGKYYELWNAQAQYYTEKVV